MIELVRRGRTPEELAREFEPSAQAIRNWVKQAALDAGQRTDGLTTEEREELRRLRGENRRLREQRAILSEACGRREKMVGRDGIEPPTPGFSVLCLLRPGAQAPVIRFGSPA